MYAEPSNRRLARLLVVGCLVLAMLASGATSQAQVTIDPSASAGSVPAYAGAGLAGTYYRFNDPSTPYATFTTANICYPDCQGSLFDDGQGGLIAFTNGNIADVNFLIPSDEIPNEWDSSNLSLAGYIAIAQAGTYDFTLGSDDSSSLTIGGQSVLGIPGCCMDVEAPVTFGAAGLYPIAVEFMESGGGSLLNLSAFNDATGDCLLACTDGNGNPTNGGVFYSDAQLEGAPAPTVGAGWPGILTLLAGGASIRYRRGRKTT